MKLRVGIVGLGEHWESRHLPALRALADRFEVRGICEQVSHRAQRAASQLGAVAVDGFRALAARVASRDEPTATDPHPRMIAQFGPWVVARTRGSRAGAKGGLPGLSPEPGPPPGDGRKPQ